MRLLYIILGIIAGFFLRIAGYDFLKITFVNLGFIFLLYLISFIGKYSTGHNLKESLNPFKISDIN